MVEKKTIAVLTGGRQDWGLLEPLVAELYKKFNIQILVTGSHLSVQYGETWKEIPKEWWPDCVLCPILIDWDNAIGVTKSMALALMSAPELLANLKPDLLLVLGDRYEVLSFSIAAYNLSIPVAHIQSSDTTLGSLDEGYRACIRNLAARRFPVEEYGSLGCVVPELKKDLFPAVEYICMYHAYKGNWKEDFLTLLDVLKDKSVLYIGSNADAGGRQIHEILLNYNLPTVISLKRQDFLSVLSHCKAIIGDSSSGLIEAPTLKVPTINIGSRQKGRLKAKSVIDAEPNRKSIEAAFERIKTLKPESFENPYYKPNIIEKISSEIGTYLG